MEDVFATHFIKSRHWTVKVATYQDLAGNITTKRIKDLTEKIDLLFLVENAF